MGKIIETLSEIWAKRNAWWFLATTKTRERYARTRLGSLWASITTLISISLLGTVYSKLLNVSDIKEYIAYLGVGLISWQTISASINSSSKIFKANAANIKNLTIHPAQYTFAEWAFQVQTFLQSFTLVIICLSFVNHSLPINTLFYGIPAIINFLIFMYWAPAIISIVGAKFEDITQLVPVLLQLTFLLSPILYERTALDSLSWIPEINPIYTVLANLRSSILDGELNMVANAYILIFNLAGTVIAIHILNINKKKLPFIL